MGVADRKSEATKSSKRFVIFILLSVLVITTLPLTPIVCVFIRKSIPGITPVNKHFIDIIWKHDSLSYVGILL
ncbi:hypothetical protein FD09_GL000259 [Schleiferilactobacillus perolens DSM 12744]|uniref:Uncharacterized protein n=1 Tax=Schleiferilactobacillus perolens DSM 12744 TaxID=1423792 RepID=A0A0R1N328_9LACO|nr:hypothetical protein FD09_GL000259 [Schleiferilactobacillus perolens DSM 12744]